MLQELAIDSEPVGLTSSNPPNEWDSPMRRVVSSEDHCAFGLGRVVSVDPLRAMGGFERFRARLLRRKVVSVDLGRCGVVWWPLKHADAPPPKEGA